MTTNAAQTKEPDDGLTPGERAYANGGDVEGLKKEGLEIQPAGQEPLSNGIEGIQPTKVETPAEAAEAARLAAEADDDDQPELDPGTGRPKKKGGWISKKAFDAEREERKRLSQELGTTKENWARLEERFKVFQEAALASAPQDEPQDQPLPDPEQDVFGYLKAVAERDAKRYSALEQRLGTVHESTQARAESSDLVTAYSNDARRFAQNQPDFGDAYRFLIAQRDNELAAAGYDDPQERARLIQADEQAIVRRCQQTRGPDGRTRSPAETVYNLAKARGYAAVTPSAAGAPPPAGSPTNPPATLNSGATGAAPAAGGGAPAAPSAADEIARVQAGQNASLSLSNVGGNRPNNMSITDLVNMSDDDFRAFARKNPNLLEQMAGK